MQMSWADSHKDAPLGTHIFVAVCIFVLAILVAYGAYGAYKLYDLPVREWLKHKLFKSAIKREESDARINYPEPSKQREPLELVLKWPSHVRGR